MGKGLFVTIIQQKKKWFVVYCASNNWWSSRLSWLDMSYLSMGVKIAMENIRALHEALRLEIL